MKIILLFTAYIVSAATLNPHSVNLELQTSILFEPKDAENNLSFINNVKKFLDQLQGLVSPNQSGGFQYRSAGPTILTDFLTELGVALTNHTDNDLTNISIIFEKIVDELYYKESLFHEIFIDSKLKNFIRTLSREWGGTNATILRHNIQKCLSNCDPVVSKFMRKLNRYYDDADARIMKKIVKKFRKYPGKQKDLTKVITDAVKYLVFDHYNALNYSSKLKLASQLHKLTNYFTESYNGKVLDPDLAVDFRKTLRIDPGVRVSDNLIDADAKFGRNVSRKELILTKNVEVFIKRDSKKSNL